MQFGTVNTRQQAQPGTLQMCQRHGLDMTVVTQEWGDGVPADRFEEILTADKNHEIKAVMTVHNETATGVRSDVAAVRRAITEATIGITGRSTAIADGLGLALKRMEASDAPTRVIVLLSDGRDTAHRLDAVAVAGLAAPHGVRIHTIALGPDDMETRPANRDAVDTATLRAIAEASGGVSYRVRSMDDLVAMAADLDRLEADIRAGNLPPTSGFFFGETDGSETNDDLEFIAKARGAIANGKTVFYDSWW
mgnify:CR=1 FL=1